MLTQLLATDVPYIGLLGPRKRFEKMQSEFSRTNIDYSDRNWQRVYAPIGLDIGAETPDEIALSIIAKIKAVFAKRSGGFLPGPIHERPTKEPELSSF